MKKLGDAIFYDTIGRKYECDDEGNKMWTSKRRPPQYDAYIWKKLGEDGRKAILEHFHNSPTTNGMVAANGHVVDEIDMSESSVQAENQKTYLSYKKNEFLHFHGDTGPIQILWQYVLKREVVDTDSGEILDLDKEIATRSQEYMCRNIEGGPRNISTSFLWYRDKEAINLASNERQHVWECEPSHYVIAPSGMSV